MSHKNKVIFSVVYFIFGVLTVLTPTVIFPACSGKMMMSCMYTSKAEVGVGTLLAILGVISLFFTEKVRAGISIAVVGIGALIILFPTMLIGVCGSNTMKCHMATCPLLVVLGILVVLTGLGNTVYLLKRK